MLSDVLIGLVLARLFGGKSQEPTVRFSPSPVGPAPSPTPAPAPQTAVPPAFPAALPVPPALPPEDANVPTAGKKRAVEVWQVRPEQVAAARTSDPKAQQIALRLLESQFPKGWQPVPQRNVTAAEINEAKSLLGQWHDGGVVFSGGNTPSTLRAFRMTQHDAAATPATARPAPVGPVAKPAAPSSVAPVTTAPAAPQGGSSVAPAPAAAPVVTTIPEVVITATPPTGAQVTAVRRGEGLAQVAKRLGRPETGVSARELQAANVPTGPDAQWSKTDLSKGGLKKAGRAGGLQPGDRLFVPPSWGAVDASRL